MRVIAGTLKGRHFNSPESDITHPMSERMCGALFNALGDIEGLTVLDAYAGSGALSFEAVSRGAASAIAVDSDYKATQTIAHNIALLGVQDKVHLVKGDVVTWMKAHAASCFDVVLCDPPYDHLQAVVIDQLAGHVQPDGLFVLSWPSREKVPVLPGMELIRQHAYAGAQLIFYRKGSSIV